MTSSDLPNIVLIGQVCQAAAKLGMTPPDWQYLKDNPALMTQFVQLVKGAEEPPVVAQQVPRSGLMPAAAKCSLPYEIIMAPSNLFSRFEVQPYADCNVFDMLTAEFGDRLEGFMQRYGFSYGDPWRLLDYLSFHGSQLEAETRIVCLTGKDPNDVMRFVRSPDGRTGRFSIIQKHEINTHQDRVLLVRPD